MSVYRLLACSEDVTPCPSGSQVWVTVAEGVDLSQLGITAGEILTVYTWGIASVLTLWVLGYAIGAALDLIKKA